MIKDESSCLLKWISGYWNGFCKGFVVGIPTPIGERDGLWLLMSLNWGWELLRYWYGDSSSITIKQPDCSNDGMKLCSYLVASSFISVRLFYCSWKDASKNWTTFCTSAAGLYSFLVLIISCSISCNSADSTISSDSRATTLKQDFEILFDLA